MHARKDTPVRLIKLFMQDKEDSKLCIIITCRFKTLLIRKLFKHLEGRSHGRDSRIMMNNCI
jgi:hypothetical protein